MQAFFATSHNASNLHSFCFKIFVFQKQIHVLHLKTHLVISTRLALIEMELSLVCAMSDTAETELIVQVRFTSTCDDAKKSYDLPLDLLQYRRENSAEYLYL